MRDSIDQIMQRTQSYWYEDGFVELALGFLFALLGALFIAQKQFASDSPLVLLMVLGMMILVVGSSLLVKRAVQNLKQRVTYPRTGYVKYKHPEEISRVRWLIPAFAFLLVVVSFLFPALNRMSIFEGMLMSAVLCFMGYRAGVRRFYVLAAASAVAGVIATLTSAGEVLESAIFFGLFGLLLAASGGLTLWAYLSHNPPME